MAGVNFYSVAVCSLGGLAVIRLLKRGLACPFSTMEIKQQATTKQPRPLHDKHTHAL